MDCNDVLFFPFYLNVKFVDWRRYKTFRRCFTHPLHKYGLLSRRPSDDVSPVEFRPQIPKYSPRV